MHSRLDDWYFILHSGQTGVERGAHLAARAAGIAIAGFMPRDARDELGALPHDIQQVLTSHAERARRASIASNVDICTAALIVVPDARAPTTTAPMSFVLQQIRPRRLPLRICDAHTSVADVASWAAQIPNTCGSKRLLVTGPRSTRWPDGEVVARRLVMAIAAAVCVDSTSAAPITSHAHTT